MPIQMPSTNARTSSIVFSAMEAFSTGPYLLTVDVLEDLLEVIPSFRGVLALLVLGAGPFSSSFVTTPSEIIPYYCLNHSFWSLSDNKESTR
jgi:hypothetical protein